MRKILCRALLCLCLVLALGPVHTAFAQDLDRIESYSVDVTPNTEDGSLRIQVTLEWTVLAEGPVSWVKIGVPNGSIRQEQALTDNIDRLSFDNSYMYVYFNRDYDDGETFRFSYSWIQEYMYTLGADGSVEYVYTPGWFNEARVGQMTLTWHDPAGVDGVDSLGNTGGDHAAVLTDLDHGQQLDFTVRYDSWPAQLAQEGSRDNLPQDNDPGYDPDYQDDGGLGLVGLVILLVVVFLIVRVAAASDGYRGGFGTHYVFVSGLWYPAGPDGRPRPGSHGTREKPKPPRSGGFGGGSFGGGSFGGGFFLCRFLFCGDAGGLGLFSFSFVIGFEVFFQLFFVFKQCVLGPVLGTAGGAFFFIFVVHFAASAHPEIFIFLRDELRRSFFILCHFGEIALILCTEVFVLHDVRDFRLFGEIFKQQ